MENIVKVQRDMQLICDGYGVGLVENIYKDNIRGFEEEYIKIYFENIKMSYQLPLANLKYRELAKPQKINSLFKDNIKERVQKLAELNFNVQQMKMNEYLQKNTIEEIVFLLRYLDSKKRNSANFSLCGYDDTLYRKLLNHLSEELSVGTKKTITDSIVEVKKLLEKNKLDVKFKEEPSLIKTVEKDSEEDDDFE